MLDIIVLGSIVNALTMLAMASTGFEMQALLLTAVSVLGGTVAALWKSVTDHHKVTSKKLDDCEHDRECLWHAVADMKGTQPENLKQSYGDVKNK